MSVMRRRRNQPAAAPDAPPLTLRAADGTPLYVFPAAMVESYRHMVTELWYSGFPQRLALVSALRGEGVTLSALALATTLASDVSAKVAVVELNWWAPGMLRLLAPLSGPGHERRPGLADVLSGAAGLDDALIATGLPNLRLLPAGDLPVERRAAVARSAELRALIERLNALYDHLILDIPAVLSTSDAIGLAALATSCSVVVRQGVTPVSDVRAALEDMKRLPVLGVVLNQARYRTPRWLRQLIPAERVTP